MIPVNAYRYRANIQSGHLVMKAEGFIPVAPQHVFGVHSSRECGRFFGHIKEYIHFDVNGDTIDLTHKYKVRTEFFGDNASVSILTAVFVFKRRSAP